MGEDIVELVQQIFLKGVEAGASDLHFEPSREAFSIRFRIDGLLTEALRLPPYVGQGITARVKVMADLDVGEHRLPQEGRTFIETPAGTFDLRVSVIPVIHGEKVVVRLLQAGERSVALERLGFSEENLTCFQKALLAPHGLILVTGPTGSGKTTTLYAAIRSLDSRSKNITTIEDPIESDLMSIHQTQVNPKIGYTFLQGLRAILRQDPDVILVGEVRDEETAKMVIQASLTGHLVFSTLHTQDALGAIFRLRDMGIPPYLLAATLRCVVAQRLIRLRCPLGPCEQCSHTGFSGRTGVFEVLPITSRLQEQIYQGGSYQALKQVMEQEGVADLWLEAAKKIAAQVTTKDEVERFIACEGTK